MAPTIGKPTPTSLPRLTVTTNTDPKYSTDGTSTMADEKHGNLTRESTLSTPLSTQNPDPFDTDVEAMIPNNPENCPRKSMGCQRPDADCQVWPGQEHWRKKAKAAKVSRSRCGCMAKMSKRNRILIHLLILVLIVGIGLSIGFGISKPINAPIPTLDNDQD
ncbi:uncharacterized protein MKZ38_007048 [Zalerion maritima]|uniref:Uncharacterized protein n=1 Tax=Zalerion maritima TaxID=339359 RepID=A0AAD5RV28_9PEZI|nr:uncharacterized protein MKZ38_007048 [Zalerion maritima]